MTKQYNDGASKAVYNIYTADESWIYVYDLETKQQSTVWMFQDESNPIKMIRDKSALKQMVACFFGINGHMVTVPLENNKMISFEWHSTIYLPELCEEIRKKTDNEESFFNHDIASCHISAETTRLRESRKIELTGQSRYSPDLAPNDFYLFPSVKTKLRGQRFSSRAHFECINEPLMYSKCTLRNISIRMDELL
ncbi:hypothetical protein EVAR_53747_1 [Eumeta japonica]|uniref:Mariner Mos1 transposase n=1 Tax=Eumeta variegata TaxID=151549 RepID=A0A4C1ZEF2_EUMVA|nr:hypothetical protein EVAR_53747_1 [Eumeta japonica]